MRGWSGFSFGDCNCVGRIIPGRRRVLALRDQLFYQALQVIDSFAHFIPIATALGTRGAGVLGSAEFTRSLLIPSGAILARLLPVTFESENLSAIDSWEQVAG